jgi:ABC-type antimicrobial peptide transport system permease subunit
LNVGDDFVFTPEGHDIPVRLRIVGALADSVLQSELIVAERDFMRLFPRHEGYRVWLIDVPVERAAAAATLFEDRLADFGVDVVDTRSRLAAYHQVENTYLATFQALGALGLLIGTIGLAAVLARNVLERQREMGLLGAIGFGPGELQRIVLVESAVLVVGGLLLGTAAALVAVAPALVERGQAVSIGPLAALVAVVAATGLLASLAAVRMVTRMSITRAIKSE